MFAIGMVISIDAGVVSSKVINTATNDIKRMSSVITGSKVLTGRNADSSLAATSFTVDGKTVVYLTKSADAFHQDMTTLRVSEGGRRKPLVGSNDAIRGNRITVTADDKHIRMESDLATLDIAYIRDGGDSTTNDAFSTASSERNRVLQENKSRAETEAWLLERSKIERGLRTNWSKKELDEIMLSGKLSAYKSIYKWSPDKYPELASSGRNIIFVKT